MDFFLCKAAGQADRTAGFCVVSISGFYGKKNCIFVIINH